MTYFLTKKRVNMAERQAETFKPPLHLSKSSKIKALIIRFLDLQFGSIWRDLSVVLPQVSGTVLDIGCGGQPFRQLFDEKKVKYIGIDTAESKPNFGYHNNETLYYSGKTLPIEDCSSDFILCTETLEHILEPSWLLNEMWRSLRPKGEILITVPFAARWHFIPFDYWRYTPSSLLHLLQKSGFKNIKVYARGNQLSVACYKVIGLFLVFLLSGNKKLKIMKSPLGLFLLPCIFTLALIANISIIKTKVADDCLGFTLLAEK